MATVCVNREDQLQDPVTPQLSLLNFVMLGKLLSVSFVICKRKGILWWASIFSPVQHPVFC